MYIKSVKIYESECFIILIIHLYRLYHSIISAGKEDLDIKMLPSKQEEFLKHRGSIGSSILIQTEIIKFRLQQRSLLHLLH